MGLFDDERFKNLMVFKIYATDKELEQMAPWIFVLVIVIVITAIIVSYC